MYGELRCWMLIKTAWLKSEREGNRKTYTEAGTQTETKRETRREGGITQNDIGSRFMCSIPSLS